MFSLVVLGRYTLEALYKACQQEKLTFAVAGRSEGRLNEALEVFNSSESFVSVCLDLKRRSMDPN